MTYEYKISKEAWKFISSQDVKQRDRILRAIYSLPLAGDIKKLKGSGDQYRLRVGNYRIIFTKTPSVKDGVKITIIFVVDADNRGQIYK